MNFRVLTTIIGLIVLFWQADSSGLARTEKTKNKDNCVVVQSAPGDGRPRFALLVGIKEYPKDSGIPSLAGGENDVELMRCVLKENYGFADADIRTLKTTEAKRDNILNEFRNFLIANAEKNKAKNPIIVFYFSGHGTRYSNQPDDTLDSDNEDGFDEAIVPFDSRAAGVFDILDDEIDELSIELSRHTTNILYILDSCNSGTATRGDFTTREAPPKPNNAERKLFVRKPASAEDKKRTENIVTIAAALPHQPAFPRQDLSNGLMTFHLAAALRRASRSTTYEDLMREVRAAVQNEGKSSQHPFADGDHLRPVLGEASNRADPSIRALSDVENGKIKFAAGKILGVQPGAQVAIYEKEAKKFTGEEGFLTYASVLEVGESEAVVVLPDEKTNPKVKSVNKDSRFVLASPTFGGKPMGLLIDDVSLVEKMGEADESNVRKEILNILEQPNNRIMTNKVIQLVSQKDLQILDKEEKPETLIQLRRGKFGEVFCNTSLLRLPSLCPGKDTFFPPGETDVYYLQDGTDKQVSPILGIFFPVGNPKNSAANVLKVIEIYARHRNVRNLENTTSSLNNMIEIEIKAQPTAYFYTCPVEEKAKVRTKCACEDAELPAIQNNRMPQNRAFTITIKKKMLPAGLDKRLFIAPLLVTGDGKIELITSNFITSELSAGKPYTFTLVSTQPPGTEMVKIIMATDPMTLMDIPSLQNPDFVPRSGALLAQLVNQSGEKSRGNASLSPGNPSSWGVKTVEWTVSETKFSCKCKK